MEQDIQKKEYEVAFLFKEETDAPALIADLKALGAEIHQEGPVNKIALAYEIKNEATAYFGFVQCAMEPAVAKSLEASLLLRPNLLRSLVMTPPTAKQKPHMAPTGETPTRPAAKPYEPKAVAPALSNEALEKKIEEILK